MQGAHSLNQQGNINVLQYSSLLLTTDLQSRHLLADTCAITVLPARSLAARSSIQTFPLGKDMQHLTHCGTTQCSWYITLLAEAIISTHPHHCRGNDLPGPFWHHWCHFTSSRHQQGCYSLPHWCQSALALPLLSLSPCNYTLQRGARWQTQGYPRLWLSISSNAA